MISEYIKKYNKINDESLKYDFMPSLQEIIERPAHKSGSIIIVTIFTMLIVLVIWAMVSKIDMVVNANGILLPLENISQIKSMVSGSIKKINVSDGDFVRKGEILFELDDSYEELEINQLTEKQKMLEVENKIYTSLSNDIYKEIDINEYEEEFHNLVNIANSENKLFKKNNNETSKLQYEMQIKQKLLNINEELKKTEKSLKEYNIKVANMKISATIDGYVSENKVNFTNQVISANEILASIVPGDSEYEFKGYILDKDIDLLELDKEAEIKLNAYSSFDYGTINGRIAYISKTSVADERLGNIYIIKVKVDNIPDGIELISGLTGRVEIKVKKRSILDYFLEPISKTVSNSLKE